MDYSICARKPAAIAAAILCLWMVSGCAASGKATLSDAALSGDPDAMWAEGQELSRKGERLVKKGEERMADGRAEVRKGEETIRKGSEDVTTSRRDYENAARSTGDAATPKAVASEAKRLKTYWQTLGRRHRHYS